MIRNEIVHLIVYVRFKYVMVSVPFGDGLILAMVERIGFDLVNWNEYYARYNADIMFSINAEIINKW